MPEKSDEKWRNIKKTYEKILSESRKRCTPIITDSSSGNFREASVEVNFTVTKKVSPGEKN